jgi:predicted transcriptional regulator
MQEQLEAIGLSELQAKIYLYLLDYANGRKPAQVAEALGFTRTNTYKVLDQLCEYDLVRRSDTSRTYRYYAENPIALASFVAEARNHARELEEAVKVSVGLLQKHYQKGVRHADVRTAHGKPAITQAYTAQAKSGKEIHFIKSRHDIPFMGFATMRQIRTEPSLHGQQRFGITPAAPEVDTNVSSDEKTNLTRTLVPSESYTSPVEWMTSGDELSIVSFTDKGSVIRIKDPVIADAFRELWQLLDSSVHARPFYEKMSRDGR